MTIARDKILFFLTAIWWATIGYIVIDYNLGLGKTTLRWPNPRHNSAAWSWDAAEVTPATLEPRSGQWLRLTLPRGFSTATLNVRTKNPAELILRAEPREDGRDIVRISGGTTHGLSFSWVDLIARGKTFRFRLENPTDLAVEISQIIVTTSR